MPETPEQWERRQRRWRHLALAGSAVMALGFCREVMRATSTTVRAKELAVEAERALEALKNELKNREGC